jgi:hypothetical protein
MYIRDRIATRPDAIMARLWQRIKRQPSHNYESLPLSEKTPTYPAKYRKNSAPTPRFLFTISLVLGVIGLYGVFRLFSLFR